MMENKLTQVLSDNQDKIDNRKIFYGIIKDSFSTERMKSNLLLNLYDMKIHEEIFNTSVIGNAFAFRFVKRLIDEYGVSRKNADWAVSYWCVCYGRNVLGKKCEIKLADYDSASAPVISDERQRSGTYTSLFAYGKSEVDNAYEVISFNGDNDNTVIFQNNHDGKKVIGIGALSFSNSTVKEAIITEGYSRIGRQAFQECLNLSQVIMPSSMVEIADYAFDGCSQLSTLMLPANLQTVGKYAFARTGLKQVMFPKSLYWIDEGAFSDCSKIVDITLPCTIRNIPDKCFAFCDNLTKVRLEEGIETIGYEAFRRCANILEITIPDTVISIGENAFSEMNPKFLIQCSAKSYAEEYARKFRIKYQLI